MAPFYHISKKIPSSLGSVNNVKPDIHNAMAKRFTRSWQLRLKGTGFDRQASCHINGHKHNSMYKRCIGYLAHFHDQRSKDRGNMLSIKLSKPVINVINTSMAYVDIPGQYGGRVDKQPNENYLFFTPPVNLPILPLHCVSP